MSGTWVPNDDELTGALARAAAALRAPPPVPLPADFATRVCRRAARPAGGGLDWLGRGVAAWLRPRTVRVRPALQLAWVALLCTATGAISLWLSRHLGAGEAPVLVRFWVAAPSARTVTVAGDFNGWDSRSIRLQDRGGGRWEAVVPLQPGVYQYMFVIDEKRWIPDPTATETVDDGFGQRNSLMRIDDDPALL